MRDCFYEKGHIFHDEQIPAYELLVDVHKEDEIRPEQFRALNGYPDPCVGMPIPAFLWSHFFPGELEQ